VGEPLSNEEIAYRVVDKTFPALQQREVMTTFRALVGGAQHDTVWRCCDGDTHHTHRLVLALSSPLFR